MCFSYHDLGNVYNSQRNYQDALDNYNKAISLNSKVDFFYEN
ncbi:MAG: hypothetical protein HC852_03030 [Acaryochloridaceae cyanobacterium RU_4_10]|nr:hypothetical protein [Acaryochloridaceae cyanobacterium RU_4_10]